MDRLSEELQKYSRSDAYPFHMPGHKRRGNPLFAADITEIDGFDNLHDPQGILLEEMHFASAFYQTEETYFSVNGSTCCLLAAISAAVPRGGRLMLERSAHISVYHAADLRNLELLYIDGPGVSPPPESAPAQKKPDAVLITSPTYEGCVKDLRPWAAYARKQNIPLIVDEAHGAHFSMHPYFPESAIRLGADLVIQSTHKTLPAMTQTALLHNVTGRVSGHKLQRYLDIYETSSPSYVLLSSVTSAIHQCFEHGDRFFGEYVSRLRSLRSSLSKLKQLRLLGGAEAIISSDSEFPPFAAGTSVDPGKLVILCRNLLSGSELYDILRGRYQLQPEMKAPDYCLLMTSVSDTDEGFERLQNALFEIDSLPEPGINSFPYSAAACSDRLHLKQNNVTSKPAFSSKSGPKAALPPVRMRISEASEAACELLPLKEAAGRIAADYICVYPPDTPLFVPGEEITEQAILRINELLAAGLSVTGLSSLPADDSQHTESGAVLSSPALPDSSGPVLCIRCLQV